MVYYSDSEFPENMTTIPAAKKIISKKIILFGLLGGLFLLLSKRK